VDYLPAEFEHRHVRRPTPTGGARSGCGERAHPPGAAELLPVLRRQLKIECPTGSGKLMNLFEVSKEIADRLGRSFYATNTAGDPSTGSGEIPGRSPLARLHPLLRVLPQATTARAGPPAIRPAGPGSWPRPSQLNGLLDPKRALEVGKTVPRSPRVPAPPGGRRVESVAQATPVIYEINTGCGLGDLGRNTEGRGSRHGSGAGVGMPSLPLASTPCGSWGCGRGARPGIEISMRPTRGSSRIFRESPPPTFGGGQCRLPILRAPLRRRRTPRRSEGLTTARNALAKRSIRLILDFVPNHVAPDHPWSSNIRNTSFRGAPDDARNDPASFVEAGETVFARGRIPTSRRGRCTPAQRLPAWAPAAVDRDGRGDRGQCDGIRWRHGHAHAERCFERTWGPRAASEGRSADYWTTVIPGDPGDTSGFGSWPKPYWGLEWELQQQGFD